MCSVHSCSLGSCQAAPLSDVARRHSINTVRVITPWQALAAWCSHNVTDCKAPSLHSTTDQQPSSDTDGAKLENQPHDSPTHSFAPRPRTTVDSCFCKLNERKRTANAARAAITATSVLVEPILYHPLYSSAELLSSMRVCHLSSVWTSGHFIVNHGVALF